LRRNGYEDQLAVTLIVVPQQNPITRIEHVARDLGRLASEIEDYAGTDASAALLYWRGELLEALEDIRRLTAGTPK
jgi:hypothetical protein